MKIIGTLALILFCIGLALFADQRNPEHAARQLGIADEVLINKSQRTLTLLNKGVTIVTYNISLGQNPTGHKQHEGDSRTPEGDYIIDWRNSDSRFYKSLHISYPNEADIAAAATLNKPPGGDIMIHGWPNGSNLFGSLRYRDDWTDGCIAVSNTQMEEIWNAVPNGTPIEIRP